MLSLSNGRACRAGLAVGSGLLLETLLGGAVEALYADSLAAMFLLTTSVVLAASSVGLNETTSLPSNSTGVVRRGVVRVARLVRLVPVSKPERDLALDHISPVRTLASIIRESLEDRCGIHVCL